jgi:hypothetical protein
MDTQQVNTGAGPGAAAPAAPEASQPYSIPPGMTPEAAHARAKELTLDKDFGARLFKNGKDSREARELDALQRHAVSGGAEVLRAQPSSVRIPAGMTSDGASLRIKELMADPDWRAKYMKGGKDSKEARELDALQRHAMGVESKTPGEALTPEQARAAALNEVPKSPEGYEIDWRDASPGDPVPEEGVKAITSWAHGAGLTQSETSTMVYYAGRDVAKWQRMDDAARELHMSDSVARFNKMHGDEAPAMLEGARRLVAELGKKDPALKLFLEDSGAGASLGVISALADAASRRYGTQQRPSGVTPKRRAGG